MLAALCLAGCGYPSDPLPPALNIPQPVKDLRAVQRGSEIVVTFTAPELTTEDLGIREFEIVDLRAGPVPQDFSMENWANGARHIQAETPEPGKPVLARASATEWKNREVLVAVRLKTTRGRRPSQWSNSVTLSISEPLATPAVQALQDPAGVRLTWAAQPGAQYRVSRAAEGEENATVVGTVPAGEYIDKSAALGKRYRYSVQGFNASSESEPSPAVSIVPRDEFPPKPPSGLMGVAGIQSVELAWDRNTEPDLANYRLYRATGTSDFAVLVDSVDGVAFSDRQISSGMTYRYRLTALDRSGNESGPSSTVQIAIP